MAETPPKDLVTPPSDLVSPEEQPKDLVSPPSDLVSPEEPKRYTAADIPDDQGRLVPESKPRPEPSLLDKIVAPFETAVGLGGGMAAGLVGQIAGVGAGIASGEFGKPGGAGERTAEKVTEMLSPKTTNIAAQEQLEKANQLMQESGVTALMPGMHPAIPALGEGAGAFAKQAISKKAPLVETAFREKATGKVTTSGPKHDEAFKEASKDTHEQGFIDETGKFLTRKEAADRAKETKQLPKDQTLERPEEGLHSGDLRKAGSERFAIPEDVLKTPEAQPIDTSTPEKLAFELHKTTMQHQADFSATSEFMESAKRAGVTEEDTKAFLDYSEARAAGEEPVVTKEFAEKYDKWDGALQKEIVDTMKRMNPEEAATIRDNFSNRIAMKKSMLIDTLKEERQSQLGGQMKGGFAKKPTSEKSRTVFALEDGSTITTKRIPQGWQVTKWDNGEPTILGTNPVQPREGEIFLGQKIKQAQKKDIEANTHIRYLDNGLAVKSMLLNSLRKAEREREVIRQIKESDYAKAYMHPADSPYTAPEGFRELSPAAKEALPALRDSMFAPEYAEVLEDFAGRYRESGTLDAINSAIIRAMMINPYPHFMNELVHWFDSRGATGVLSPFKATEASMGLPGLKFVPDAIRSVMKQDEFQRELMRKGGFLLAPATKAMQANKSAMQIGMKTLLKDAVAQKSIKDIASALGTTPGRIMMKVSDLSSNVMWSSRDMMYTHLIKEQMGMGKSMEDAIHEVGKHMPEYFLPHRVLGSRRLSQAMQSKLFVFSRYHYGWMRAYGENAKELAQLGKNNPEFAKGLDHALGMALGGLVLYKGLDAMYSSMFGQDVEARRAGAYHAPDVAVKVAKGEKDYPSLLSAFFTVNPAIMGVGQVAANRDWQGKQIIPAGTDAWDAALLATRYVGSQMMPVQSLERSVEDTETPSQFLARMTDAKIEDAKKQRALREKQAKLARKNEEMIKKLKQKYGI